MKYLLLLFLFPLQAIAQYNFYYGNIHSHTEYSDGNKDSLVSGVSTPAGSYSYAKNSYHIDFWGISEHNHYNANNNPGMLLPRYAAGLYQADTSNANGLFVAMYGLEFGTISQGGHVVAYGSPGLLGWEDVNGGPNYDTYCPLNDFNSFWSLFNSYPNAFVTLAHPQTHDYNELIDSAAFNPTADSIIVGSAVRSGDAFSTTTNYTDPPANSYEFRFRKCLAWGYHVAPSIDHDNHYTTFGRTVQGRTVVLATTLHRDSIIAAYRARRFYASDDWNSEVHYTVNGHPMGSNISTNVNPTISVVVNDLDVGDEVAMIDLYYGVPGSGVLSNLLTSAVANTNSLTFTHPCLPGDHFYYYAKITQLDGDIMWTAPIWVQREVVPLAILLSNLNAEVNDDNVALEWTVENATDIESLHLEHSLNGIDFFTLQTYPLESLHQKQFSFLHRQPENKVNYYRIRVNYHNQKKSYSTIDTSLLSNPKQQFTFYPNPASETLNILFQSKKFNKGLVRIYDANGRQVHIENVNIETGENRFHIDISCYAKGLFYFVLQVENERLVDASFSKQ